MSDITIRNYTEQDHDDVVRVWREQLEQSRPHHDVGLSIDRKVVYQPEFFFVAVADGKVIGTVMGGYDGHRGWLYSVAVTDEYQRQGVATRLVLHVEEAMRKLGCVKINLQVMPQNTDAIAFWEALGW
ncbi:MAG TPA: GNAT family acetyltransferase, partial [candidate division Zixibacteria bacterium]|nr:GNAT family acetyltransferase [candidate division Zixibacteria bacterium]